MYSIFILLSNALSAIFVRGTLTSVKGVPKNAFAPIDCKSDFSIKLIFANSLQLKNALNVISRTDPGISIDYTLEFSKQLSCNYVRPSFSITSRKYLHLANAPFPIT